MPPARHHTAPGYGSRHRAEEGGLALPALYLHFIRMGSVLVSQVIRYKVD